MNLSLFALALVSLHPVVVAPPQEDTPVVAAPSASARLPGHLEIRIDFRARGPTASAAALEVSTLLATLRDSLRDRRFGDSSLQLGLRALTPAPNPRNDPEQAFDAAITLTLGAGELPRLPELLAALTAAGPVAVSDVQVKFDQDPLPYAGLLAQAVAASEQQRLSLPSIGGKVGTIALILLAIRREFLR